MVFLLLLVIAVALALFLIGVIAHGLFYLLVIGVVVFVVAVIFTALRNLGSGRRSGR